MSYQQLNKAELYISQSRHSSVFISCLQDHVECSGFISNWSAQSLLYTEVWEGNVATPNVCGRMMQYNMQLFETEE